MKRKSHDKKNFRSKHICYEKELEDKNKTEKKAETEESKSEEEDSKEGSENENPEDVIEISDEESQCSSQDDESKTDSKERSFVWVHFDKVTYNGVRYAKCKYCR